MTFNLSKRRCQPGHNCSLMEYYFGVLICCLCFVSCAKSTPTSEQSDIKPILKVVVDSSAFDSASHYLKKNLHVFVSLGNVGNTQIEIVTKENPVAEFYGFAPGKYQLRVFSEVQSFWETYVPDFRISETMKIVEGFKMTGQVAWHPVGQIAGYPKYDTIKISKDSLFHLIKLDTSAICFRGMQSDSIAVLMNQRSGHKLIFSDPDDNQGYVYVGFDSTNVPITWGCSDYSRRFGDWTYVDPSTRDTCKFQYGGFLNNHSKKIKEAYLESCLKLYNGFGLPPF